MDTVVRACVAYIAGRLISGWQTEKIFDFSNGKQHIFGGSVTPQRVHVYDYDRHCYFGGDFNGTIYPLWHHKDRHYIDLQISGESFSGFDHAKGKVFQGKFTAGKIQLCDYQTNSFFHYSM